MAKNNSMKKIISALCLLLLFGCKNNPVHEFSFTPPVFNDTVKLTRHIINDTLITSDIEGLLSYKNYFILVTTTKDDKKLSILDKKTGAFIKSFVNIGRGPGEVSNSCSISINQSTGDIILNDGNRRNILKYNIDSVLAGNSDYYEPISLLQFEKTLKGIRPCQGGFLLNTGKSALYHDAPRFALVDNSGNIITTYNAYPKLKGDKTLNDTSSMIHENIGGSSRLSPDGTQLLSITTLGVILETFEISKNRISPIAIQGFYEPEYNIVEVDGFHFPQPNEKTTMHIGRIYAGNKYIYLQLYDPNRPLFSNTDKPQIYNQIGVFDWKGKSVKLLKTDCDISRFYVDEDNSKIYATTFPDDHLVYFDL